MPDMRPAVSALPRECVGRLTLVVAKETEAASGDTDNGVHESITVEPAKLDEGAVGTMSALDRGRWGERAFLFAREHRVWYVSVSSDESECGKSREANTKRGPFAVASPLVFIRASRLGGKRWALGLGLPEVRSSDNKKEQRQR